MLPITLLVGDAVEPWVDSILESGARCALFTKNPSHFRKQYSTFTSDFRLILLCESENETFKGLLLNRRQNRVGSSHGIEMLEAAIAYIGEPEALVICDVGITEEVIDLISSRDINGVSKVIFPGISDEIFNSLKKLKFKSLSLLRKQTKEDGSPLQPVKIPMATTNDLKELFHEEFFCVER